MTKINSIIVKPNPGYDTGETSKTKINEALKDMNNEPIGSATFDNSGTSIGAGTVQGALEELDSDITGLKRVTEVRTSNFTASPDINYLIDPAAGMVLMTLPLVTTGNYDKFFATLHTAVGHGKIVVSGETQLIGSKNFLSLATLNGYIELAANGVNGYDILVDSREDLHTIDVQDNLDLTEGFESGALYVGNLADSQTAVITIPNAIREHMDQIAKFVKNHGDNATFRVVSENGEFDEIITVNNKGFTISCVYDSSNSVYEYIIIQDSRPSDANIAINFLPTDTASSLEPTYYTLETESQAEEVVTSAPITSDDPDSPTSLGFWINDNKALVGSLPATEISAFAQVKKTSDFTREARIKFKYYEYNYETSTLNTTPLLETSYSSLIDYFESYEQKTVGGTLPANDWAETDLVGMTLVVELLAYKEGSGGATSDPTIDIRTGGTAPSKTTIDVPVASVSHDSLGNISDAGIGVTKGHVNNSVPLVFPTLTTTQRNAVASPNTSMKIYNSTTAQFEKWNGSAWVADSIISLPIGGAASDEDTDLVAGATKLTYRMPCAMALLEVRANVKTAPTGSGLIVDINEDGATILSTKISIDVSEKTSVTAATAPVISDSNLADDSEITIDLDQIGATIAGTGLKIWLIGLQL